MINKVQDILAKIGKFEIKHFYLMIIIFTIITGLAIIGITKLEFQSDLSKNNPKDLPIVKLNDRISSKFSEKTDPIIVLIEIDDKTNLNKDIYDIRDPKIINYIIQLKKNLLQGKKILEVSAISDFFPYGVPNNLEEVKQYLINIPGSESIINKKYTLTPVIITTDLTGADETKVRALNNRITEIIDETGNPGGIKISVTGTPPLAASIFRLLINDALFTILAAALLIFLLLILIERSVIKAGAIMSPLILGVIWSVGALGWFNVPISIGTAGLSAMMLGLGVEYSIFLFSRYHEERKKKARDQAIVEALSTTGASTMTSGLTTVIGFGTLMLSIFPILSDMGFTLSLGIIIILAAIMLVSPIIMIIEENISKKRSVSDKFLKKVEKGFEKYGSRLVKRPVLFIILPLLLTGALFFGISHIKSQDINFNNVLPANMPELIAYNKINHEFGQSSGVSIYIELDPSSVGTDEPTDIRDPRIIRFIDILTQKSKELPYFISVNSISEYEKNLNIGTLPETLSEQKNLLANKDISNIISKDNSAAIIQINLNDDANNHRPEIEREVKEIISQTQKPAGVYIVGSGGIIIEEEFNRIVGPDSSKTAIYSFVIIIILLLILTKSIKYTVLPLITVVFAIIWALGLIGILQIPFNSITSSVLSMTIGVGIDFGIQISMRYVYERKDKDKKTAMKETLKNTLYPLTITLIAALIGFRAMTLGQLKIMGDLGNVISLGVLGSMAIAITLVAGLIIVMDRKENIAAHLSKTTFGKAEGGGRAGELKLLSNLKQNENSLGELQAQLQKGKLSQKNIRLKNPENLTKKSEVKVPQKLILRKNRKE